MNTFVVSLRSQLMFHRVTRTARAEGHPRDTNSLVTRAERLCSRYETSDGCGRSDICRLYVERTR
jgi:hypothetical protein